MGHRDTLLCDTTYRNDTSARSVNRETADNFMRLFVNRRAYAIQAERALPNDSVPYYPARDWKTEEPNRSTMEWSACS
jgi:hypothetical protein